MDTITILRQQVAVLRDALDTLSQHIDLLTQKRIDTQDSAMAMRLLDLQLAEGQSLKEENDKLSTALRELSIKHDILTKQATIWRDNCDALAADSARLEVMHAAANDAANSLRQDVSDLILNAKTLVSRCVTCKRFCETGRACLHCGHIPGGSK